MKRFIEPASAGLIWTAKPNDAAVAVIFVHGLDGRIDKTWRLPGEPAGFIERLQHDLPQVAVAAYDYPSALRSIVANPAWTLQAQANQLATVLRQAILPNYSKVIFIAHCLGGLLCTMAVRSLIDGGDLGSFPAPLTSPPAARMLLFLLDTPHDLPASGPSQWLSGLLGALSLTPAALAANADFWRQTLRAGPVAQDSVSSGVSAYAIVSTQPSWVSQLQPDHHLPAEFVCRLDLPHEALTHAPISHAPKTSHGADGVATPFAPYDVILQQLRRYLS